MKNNALFVLLVFGCLIVLQTGCTAGWLTHCDRHAGSEHDLTPCRDDHCGEVFATPGKSTVGSSAAALRVIVRAPGYLQRIEPFFSGRRLEAAPPLHRDTDLPLLI